MEWTQSETLALALPSCVRCHGIGITTARSNKSCACPCVYRAIFRACYGRFRECRDKEKRLSQVTLEFSPRGGRRITWGRKDEEYVADFYLVARRVLPPLEWTVFNFHYLLGADWRLCLRYLRLDRGQFFHLVYRLQTRLGRVFRELQPYSLFPLDEYFNGRTVNRIEGTLPFHQRNEHQTLHDLLDVPVRRVA